MLLPKLTWLLLELKVVGNKKLVDFNSGVLYND
jgi:hypothetical protein